MKSICSPICFQIFLLVYVNGSSPGQRYALRVLFFAFLGTSKAVSFRIKSDARWPQHEGNINRVAQGEWDVRRICVETQKARAPHAVCS